MKVTHDPSSINSQFAKSIFFYSIIFYKIKLFIFCFKCLRTQKNINSYLIFYSLSLSYSIGFSRLLPYLLQFVWNQITCEIEFNFTCDLNSIDNLLQFLYLE